jgi:hypothetical protein
MAILEKEYRGGVAEITDGLNALHVAALDCLKPN